MSAVVDIVRSRVFGVVGERDLSARIESWALSARYGDAGYVRGGSGARRQSHVWRNGWERWEFLEDDRGCVHRVNVGKAAERK